MRDGGDITLTLGDAMAELAKIPAGSVDMVLTDPPYGITAAEWDKRPDWSALFAALWRVLKGNGALLTFAQMPVAAELVMQQRRHFRYEWVWHKSSPAGFLNSHRMPMRQHELVLVYYRRLPTYNAVPIASQSSTPYKTQRGKTQSRLFHPSPRVTTHCKDGSRFPQDVVKYDRPANTDRLHPTQKPLDLLAMLIGQYTHPGELVLDPFAGSGSTLKAAQLTGRRAIGIELDPTYFARARDWLNA